MLCFLALKLLTSFAAGLDDDAASLRCDGFSCLLMIANSCWGFIYCCLDFGEWFDLIVWLLLLFAVFGFVCVVDCYLLFSLFRHLFPGV